MMILWREPPNRSAEYRRRAEEARMLADTARGQQAQESLRQVADTWERMAQWEDKNNPERPVPGSD